MQNARLRGLGAEYEKPGHLREVNGLGIFITRSRRSRQQENLKATQFYMSRGILSFDDLMKLARFYLSRKRVGIKAHRSHDAFENIIVVAVVPVADKFADLFGMLTAGHVESGITAIVR